MDEGKVRGLNVVDSEGNIIQDDSLKEDDKLVSVQQQMRKEQFETPPEELDYLLQSCPYDSEQQASDVRFILSPLDPPLTTGSKYEKPSPDQMEQLEARRNKKAELFATASLGVRSWLKQIWKVHRQVGKWDRSNR